MSAAPELRAQAKALRAARDKALRASGNETRKALNAASAKATGGDREYSGASGTKLAVTVKVESGGNRSTMTVKPTGKSAALWVWADTGTNPGARRYRRGRRRGTVMNHPGTKGRMAWQDTAESSTRKTIDDLGKAVRQVFS